MRAQGITVCAKTAGTTAAATYRLGVGDACRVLTKLAAGIGEARSLRQARAIDHISTHAPRGPQCTHHRPAQMVARQV